MLLKIAMLFAVTFIIYGLISNATTSQSIQEIGNYKMIRNYGTVKNMYKILYLFYNFQIIKPII